MFKGVGIMHICTCIHTYVLSARMLLDAQCMPIDGHVYILPADAQHNTQ